jgi:hypothetical protein
MLLLDDATYFAAPFGAAEPDPLAVLDPPGALDLPHAQSTSAASNIVAILAFMALPSKRDV